MQFEKNQDGWQWNLKTKIVVSHLSSTLLLIFLVGLLALKYGGSKIGLPVSEDLAQWGAFGISLLSMGSLLIGASLTRSLFREFENVSQNLGLSSRQVADSSMELSNASNNLSRIAQEQASAIEVSNSTVIDVSGMMGVMSKSADISSQTAQEAFSMSQETSQAMETLSEAMSEILESNQRIEQLVKIIEQVAEKTEVIDDIVFKTQLLSFNASVEAERAGEHGRGFSVVAQEVGNLAQMSGTAAREIAGIVKNSIKEAELVSTDNKARVDRGSKLLMDTRSKMEGLQVSLLDILLSIKGIVNATAQQNDGMQRITATMNDISIRTQTTASTAEETASSSTELSGQAQNLLELADRLDSSLNGTYSHH